MRKSGIHSFQDPNNTQNYNKYSYVLNNPLKYTDPSGYRSQRVYKLRAPDMDGVNYAINMDREAHWAAMHSGGDELNAFFAVLFGGSGTGGGAPTIGSGSGAPDGGSAAGDGGPDGGDGNSITYLIGLSLDFTIATPLGGYTYEIGWICSIDGFVSKLYQTYGIAYGFEASASINLFILIPTTSSFSIDDFEGMGYSWDATYFGSITIGGDGTSSYPEDIVGNNYMVYKVGIGVGAGYVGTCKTQTEFLNNFFLFIGPGNYIWF